MLILMLLPNFPPLVVSLPSRPPFPLHPQFMRFEVFGSYSTSTRRKVRWPDAQKECPRRRAFFRSSNVYIGEISALVGEWLEYYSMMLNFNCVYVIYAFNSLVKDW